MTRTPKACIPWLIRTRPESLRSSSDSSKKATLRGGFIFYHEIVCGAYSLESLYRGDTNEYTKHTIIV